MSLYDIIILFKGVIFMSFDGIVLKSVVNELTTLIGGKIDKIYEPDKNTVVLGIYSNSTNYSLYISIDSLNYRIHLTNHPRVNPMVAPNFCMLLRKHLIGGRISNISMSGLERIANIEVEVINEFNEIEIKTLVIELMGKHSNIILQNSNSKIIDAMRHITLENSYREILPSKLYVLPTSDKLDFIALSNFKSFYLKFSNTNIEYLAKEIVNTFTGFSITFVKSAICRCSITNVSQPELEKLYDYFNKCINNNSSSLNFNYLYKDKKIADYVLILDNIDIPFHLNNFIDEFYFKKENEQIFTNLKNNYLKIVLEIQKKYENRLFNIKEKIKECNNMEKYKLFGEILTANLYRLSNVHYSSIELENYYDNNNLVSIPLDIRYSPSTNAKKYFKQYTKLKNALQIVSEQKLETQREINYLESITYELENCKTIEEVQNVVEEINENIIFKKKIRNTKKTSKAFKKKKEQSYSPIEYHIRNYNVYVGRNNKENDWLTFSFANRNDLWFHVKDIPGSHVILKNNGTTITDDILVECAKIAVKHSKAKYSSNVPVDYCLAQFVKKPNGTKPGMVIFTNNKTLNITL